MCVCQSQLPSPSLPPACLTYYYFFLSRAAIAAYGSSQARGKIGAVAASHSHSNVESKPHLQPTSQLMPTPDPNPLSEARDWTRILMGPNQLHDCWAMTGTPWISSIITVLQEYSVFTLLFFLIKKKWPSRTFIYLPFFITFHPYVEFKFKLSERRQHEKTTYCMILTIGHSRKSKTAETVKDQWFPGIWGGEGWVGRARDF